jgi:hypothetical protein
MSRSHTLALAAATLAGGLIFSAVPLASVGALAASASPHIVAHPDSVMVNTATRLTGTHFPATTKISLEECSASNWSVPQNPCTATTVKVKTNAQGRFRTAFTVHTCPGGSTTSPGFSETCYIGSPSPSGIDTIALTGAVAVTVTGP